MWAQGNQEKSLAFLQTFTARLAQDVGLGMNEPSINSPLLKPEIGELSKLLARCYLKLGEWQVALKENWDQVRPQLQRVISCLIMTLLRIIFRIFCMPIIWPNNSILRGIRHGTLGRLPTLKSSASWKTEVIAEQKRSLRKASKRI
jgi:hypothetical protein